MTLPISPDHAHRHARVPAEAWCIDDQTRDNVVARRNVLTALWAGRLMGLTGAALSDYAADVHRADYALDGDADVVGKIARDLQASGLPIPEDVVRERLWAFHAQALVQTGGTD